MPAHYGSNVSIGFKKMILVAVAASVALLLAACGDAATEPKAKIATEELVVTPNPTVAKVFYGASVNYPNGIPAFGIDTAVTLTLREYAPDTSKTGFLIKNGSDSVTGTITYGATAKTAGGSATPAALFTAISSTVSAWLSTPIYQSVVIRSYALTGTPLATWTPQFLFGLGDLYSEPIVPSYHVCVGPYGTISVSLTTSEVCTYNFGNVGVVDPSGLQ